VDGGIISTAITGTLEGVNTAQISKSAGVFDGRNVWMFYPNGTDTENSEGVVLDTVNGGWTTMTGIKPSVLHISTISGEPVIYFGSAEADGKSHQLLSGTDDDGDAIDFLVDTPAYAPQPGAKCKYKYLYITCDVQTDVDLDIDYSKDGFTFTDLATVSMTGLGAKFGYAIFGTSKFGATTIAKQRISAGGTAYYMQYRIRNNQADQDVTLREWEIFYKPRGLRAIGST
jgi:hypothetical protein